MGNEEMNMPSQTAMPPMEGPQGPDMGMPQMGGEMTQEDPMQQDQMMQQAPEGQQSQYDTNFDAGVEADEDEDPKRYIQQLTGKLSTTLNSYNSENGDDDSLNKYVAKMIVKASTKNMAPETKKDIIKAINTSSNPSEDSEEQNSEEMPMEEPQDMEQEQAPIQEGFLLTKKQLNKHLRRF